MRKCAECRFWWRDEDLPEGDEFSWGFCRPMPDKARNERASTGNECWFFKDKEDESQSKTPLEWRI